MEWLTAMWEDAASYVYHDNHCDVQPWARGCAPLLQCLGRLSLPSSVGRKNEYQLSGWVIINGDGGCRWQQPTGGLSKSWLIWSEGWRPPGAQSAFIKWAGWTLAMACHDNSTVNIILVIITARSELRKVLFLAPSVCGVFACVWNISGTAERICAKFTRKTCLVLRSDEFRGQGQRSKVKVTRDKKTAFFGPFCGLSAVYVW